MQIEINISDQDIKFKKNVNMLYIPNISISGIKLIR